MGIGPDDVVVGKIARLFKLKGHDDLLAHCAGPGPKLPKMRFLLVGDGEWRQRIENRVRALGLERHFVFTGLVPPQSVPGSSASWIFWFICPCARACLAPFRKPWRGKTRGGLQLRRRG